ncbi:MAG: phosphoserine phosphatase SerB [Paludibacteraceae bacterium]|nr:phosphoserine phosphatase SerB [Paludibacteraceae bacterium]
MEHEFILINIIGFDKPGVTSAVTEVLGKYGAYVQDIGQSNLHHQLNLSILIRIDDPSTSGDMIKEVLFCCSRLEMIVRFTPLSEEEYTAWVGRQKQDRYVITLLAREINARHIARVTELVAKRQLNIDNILRLSERPRIDTPIEKRHSCIEFSLRGILPDREALQKELLDVSREEGIDISFQKDDMFRRNRRLICVDMDSTFIQTEVIDELAMRAGVGEEVKAITLSAMRGEIDFKESFTRRVALLKGLDESVKQDILEHLPITEGADRLFRVLKKCGFKIAILSGGFTFVGKYLQERFGVDYVYANTLEVADGKFTGRYIGDVVDAKRKAELLELIAQVEHIDLAQVIAVGDGANDLNMLGKAGLGIAFHAKPKVQASAKQSISTVGLDGILYFLGFRDSFLQQTDENP